MIQNEFLIVILRYNKLDQEFFLRSFLTSKKFLIPYITLLILSIWTYKK